MNCPNLTVVRKSPYSFPYDSKHVLSPRLFTSEQSPTSEERSSPRSCGDRSARQFMTILSL